MAVAERTLADHDREIRDLRNLKHDFRAAIDGIAHLSKTVESMTATFETVARRVAAETFAAGMRELEETGREESGHRLQWAAIVFTALGFLASIYFNAR